MLLQKYGKGDCAAEEAAHVEAWLQREDAEEQLTAMEAAAWTEQAELIPENEVPLTWPVLLASVRAAGNTPGSATRIRRIGVWIAAAAAVTLLAITGIQYLLRPQPARPPLAWQEIHNDQPKVKYVIMPDGTHIWLNAWSSISYPESYSQLREVRLNGEAYFDVAADAQHPFTVTTGALKTKVLGTAFNIEAYSGEQDIKVSLVSGRVQMQPDSSGDAGKLLAPGQMFIYNSLSKQGTVRAISSKEVQAWINGNLVFNDVALDDGLRRIEKRYHIHLQFDSLEMKNKRLTTTIKLAGLEQTLQHILFVHNYTFREIKDTVFIVKK